MCARRIFPYPEERVLEDAAYARGGTPTLIVPFLLPVWCVEIEATVTDAEPYGLIDRYLERGIAEAGLATPAELARFFALDDTLVDRALRVLRRIEHVTAGPDDRLVLTELGLRSVRDQVRYIERHRDRRKLYFDAFGSRPLTRRYYDPATVTLLTGADLPDLERQGGPAFRMPLSLRAFHDGALAALAGLPDRDRFNLPDRIESPVRVGDPECVFLPVYVVRAVGSDGVARLLAYTQAADTADEDIGEICRGSPEVAGLVEVEERASAAGRAEERVREWLRKLGMDGVHPVRLPGGMLRVTLPASAFGANGANRGNGGPLSPRKIGSFAVLGCHVCQIWCTDERVRRRALLRGVADFIAPRVRVKRADLEALATRLGRQVGLGAVDRDDLRRLAAQAGEHDLLRRLDDIDD
ncbi:hypothetical protein Acsp04_18820 [Actinomadura sp. NBRC 104425]|uniref:hypothetical protein n=1 Tax=Actinomadura sp. NBRC 104425 TaxID=3032204 RepID=UPI0024A092F0|nr:hypothetical protein [Actinomadura sp. NBRC 104425]GLZ11647.1 hypothetical protein Acsp04_18820 [Actinomadura sp. NBRC 104425]